MSEMEMLVGRLIPQKMCFDIEQTAEKILCAEGWEKEDYHDSFLDALMDSSDGKYYITENSIFKVEIINNNPDDDIFIATINEDKTIDFILKYYNGGCSFSEAIVHALKPN